VVGAVAGADGSAVAVAEAGGAISGGAISGGAISGAADEAAPEIAPPGALDVSSKGVVLSADRGSVDVTVRFERALRKLSAATVGLLLRLPSGLPSASD
jgi:hypothetical protein